MQNKKKRGNFRFLENFDWWIPSAGGFALILLFVLLGTLIGGAATVLMNMWLPGLPLEVSSLIAYPFMFIPAMIYAGAMNARKQMEIEPECCPIDSSVYTASKGTVLCALVAAIATLAAGFLTDLFSLVLPPMSEALKMTLERMTGGNLVINLLAVSVLAPLFEEWLCRGMVLRGMLKHNIKPVWCILVSAVCFGLLHGNLQQGLPAFAFGLLFGYVYYRTGSLKLTMLMHCVNNTVALVLSRIDALEDMDSWMDVMGTWPYVGVCIVSAIAVCLCIRFFRKDACSA